MAFAAFQLDYIRHYRGLKLCTPYEYAYSYYDYVNSTEDESIEAIVDHRMRMPIKPTIRPKGNLCFFGD